MKSAFICFTVLICFFSLTIGCSSIEKGKEIESNTTKEIETNTVNEIIANEESSDMYIQTDKDIAFPNIFIDYVSDELLNKYESFNTLNTIGQPLKEAYLKILQNQAQFYDTNRSEYKYLDEFDDNYLDVEIQIEEFTILDMNGDSTPEVVVSLSPFGDMVVFHYENDIVYSYLFTYRGMKSLKKDGTFNFSNGAADSGFGKLYFLSNNFEIIKLGYSELDHSSINDDLTIYYYIDHHQVSEDLFISFCDEQNKKDNADWYKFRKETIKEDFSNSWNNLSTTGNGEKIIIWSNELYKDFNFIDIGYKNEDINFNYFQKNVLYSANELIPTKPLIVETNISEGIPNLGISFVDENDIRRYFYISFSGRDGSLSFVEFENIYL